MIARIIERKIAERVPTESRVWRNRGVRRDRRIRCDGGIRRGSLPKSRVSMVSEREYQRVGCPGRKARLGSAPHEQGDELRVQILFGLRPKSVRPFAVATRSLERVLDCGE